MAPSKTLPNVFEDEPMLSPPAPLLIEHEIESKRRTMRELEQRSHILPSNSSSFSDPSSASGGEDFRAQMEMMRAQIQRLEAQQRAGLTTYSDGPGSSSDQSSFGQVLYQRHADSGLRMDVNETGEGVVIEVPPAYA